MATARRILDLCEHCIEVERSRLLPWWELHEGLDLLSHQTLHFVQKVGVGKHPIPVCVRILIGPLEWVTTQVKHLRRPELHERLKPAHELVSSLLRQHHLPIAHAESKDVAVVTNVEKELPGTLVILGSQIWQQIVSIDVHFEGFVTGFVTREPIPPLAARR